LNPFSEAHALLDTRDLDTALHVASNVLDVAETEFGVDHHAAAMACIAIGEVERAAGRRDVAAAYFERALTILGVPCDDRSRTIADALDAIGDALRARGECFAAESAFLRAIETRERDEAPNPVALALSIERLARLYLYDGADPERAEPLLERAATLLESAPDAQEAWGRVLGKFVESLILRDGGRDPKARGKGRVDDRATTSRDTRPGIRPRKGSDA
jgi:tetratricopeptide (TPR) repeat protein